MKQYSNPGAWPHYQTSILVPSFSIWGLHCIACYAVNWLVWFDWKQNVIGVHTEPRYGWIGSYAENSLWRNKIKYSSSLSRSLYSLSLSLSHSPCTRSDCVKHYITNGNTSIWLAVWARAPNSALTDEKRRNMANKNAAVFRNVSIDRHARECPWFFRLFIRSFSLSLLKYWAQFVLCIFAFKIFACILNVLEYCQSVAYILRSDSVHFALSLVNCMQHFSSQMFILCVLRSIFLWWCICNLFSLALECIRLLSITLSLKHLVNVIMTIVWELNIYGTRV